jgi:DNA-binding GntR family transcriptional regulator
LKRPSERGKRKTAAREQPARGKRGRPRGTGTDTVYQSVRAQILNLTLKPGSDLDENQLVRQFKMSRTPVREALIRLSSEGLINLMPNIGARVASLTANEVPQLLEALELAQRATTRWAAVRRRPDDLEAIRSGCEFFAAAMQLQDYDQMADANHAFHLAIANAAHNSMLASFHESLQCSTLRLGRIAFSEAPISDLEYRSYYAEVDRQHREMTQAIADQDAGLADQIVSRHMALFRNRIVRHLSQSLASEVTITEEQTARPKTSAAFDS